MVPLNNLNASDNFLAELPSNLSRLASLTVLDLSTNHFAEFPAVITTLTALCRLSLSHNSIAAVPGKALWPALRTGGTFALFVVGFRSR